MSTHYRTKTFLILSKKALREGFLREGACNCGSNFSAPPLSRFFGVFLADARKIPAGGTGTFNNKTAQYHAIFSCLTLWSITWREASSFLTSSTEMPI